MAFPNKASANDMRHTMQPLSGIYPAMNMMLTGKYSIYIYVFIYR